MGDRLVYEDNVKCYWVDSVEDISEVTTTELDSGTFLPEITIDGLNVNPTNNNASIAMLDSGKIGAKPGTRSMEVTLRFARNVSDDIAWDLFEYGLSGYLVVSRFGPIESSDNPVLPAPIEVYAATAHDPVPVASAQDTYQQFEVPLAIEDWMTKAELVEAV